MDGAGLDARLLLWRLRRWWWLLLLGTLLGGAAGYGAAAAQQPVYAASVTLLVGAGQSDGTLDFGVVEAGARLAETYAQLVGTRAVLQPVIEAHDLPETVDELRAKVSTRTIADLQLLEVTVDDPDPRRAADLANAVAGSLATRSREQADDANGLTQAALAGRAAEIQRQIDDAERQLRELEQAPDAPQAADEARVASTRAALDRLRASLAALDGATNALDVNTAAAAARVAVWSEAAPPGAPARPRVPLLVLLGVLIGGMLAGVAIVARAFLDAAPRVEGNAAVSSTAGAGAPTAP